MHKVSFYTPTGKISPIKEFLDSCHESLRVKIIRQLKYVEEYGLTFAIPNIKKLTNTPFWELRILGKDNVRIICVSMQKQEVKVIHVFTKKKRKIPSKELALAARRYKEILDN